MHLTPASPRFAIVLLWVAGSIGLPVSAGIRLPALFSHNAVLQQGERIVVWGWSDPGETVTVEFRGRQRKTTSPHGRWRVELPSERAGGPDPLVIRGQTDAIMLTNVMVGEVWVCSGQSNMEWPLSRSEQPQSAIERSANPAIRLFTVPKRKATEPQDDVNARWELCGPTTVSGFSAVAYFFGRDLQAARGVPVGLIHTSWGGSPAEVWVREAYLEANPEFKRDILGTYPERKRRFDERVAAWEAAAATARAEGRQPSGSRPWGDWRPSELYNAMVYPLIPYRIAGVIWYQGEANANRADQYARLFPTLIQSWRADWDSGTFPFLAVQLAPWDKGRQRSMEDIVATPVESDWAELREAQLLATQFLKKVGLAVITDLGDKDDIHPRKKEPVGARLALAARGIAYGERIASSGPVFRSMSVSRGRAILRFRHTDGGLVAAGGELKGFQICGPDRQWVWGDARIDGKRVVVTSSAVSEPVAVRYGWADFPVVNLYNGAGLPASPFRTDNFPLTTAVER